jgi:hypothetical protein
MKAIELTEDRKEKLLEMCRALFPEYTIRFNINGFDYGIFIVTKDAGNTLNITHWFEFCLTHLAEKIVNKMQNVEKPYLWTFQGLLLLHHNDEHLVDNLYKEFKKLK